MPVARVAAAFYISSMAPEFVDRHGIAYEEVRPVVDAFGRGDVEHALALTTSHIEERLSIAGEPGDWIDRIRADVATQGYNHIALGLVDPYLVQSWSGLRVAGLPSVPDQLALFAAEVVPPLVDV